MFPILRLPAGRDLVVADLIGRESPIYHFTQLHEAVWHAEHFIMDHYLDCVVRLR